MEPIPQERPPYTRNIFHLDDGREIRFVDPRKLGLIWLVENRSAVLSDLGPEPHDPAFTVQTLAHSISDRNLPIKALLCEQMVIAGIGNIYADEILFQAGVHPLKHPAALSILEMQDLHQAIVGVLSKATEKLTPLKLVGTPHTESQDDIPLLLVPRTQGHPCARCGTSIQRLLVRGRGTYLCPKCQPD